MRVSLGTSLRLSLAGILGGIVFGGDLGGVSGRCLAGTFLRGMSDVFEERVLR